MTLGFAIALGTLAVAALGLGMWLFGLPKTVPDVVGDTVAEAAATLHEAGIAIDVADAEGTVVSQHPIAGEQWFRRQDFVLTYTDASGTHTIGEHP